MFEGYIVFWHDSDGDRHEMPETFTAKPAAIKAARQLMANGADDAEVIGSESNYGPFRVAKWIRKVDGKVMRFTTGGYS